LPKPWLPHLVIAIIPVYILEHKLNENTTFLRWKGTIEGHEFEGLELLTDGPDGKLKERTVAYRSFHALKIFREKQRAAVGDSVSADPTISSNVKPGWMHYFTECGLSGSLKRATYK
jgi:hypothetical protein